MSRTLLAGSTNHSTVVRIIDSTTGLPEVGVTSATGGLALEYRREGAISTGIAETDLSALTDAHSDGGMLHIGNGYYRLDLPDAAVAAGVTGVLVHGVATGMVVIGQYIELVLYNPQDGVRLGLTAIPDAITGAAGGLPVSAAGGLDMDNLPVASVSGNVGGDVQGNLDGSVGAGVVGDLSGDVLGSVAGNVDGTIGALAAQAKTDVNAEVVDAINVDTHAEPGQATPPASNSLVGKVGYLHKAWRNKTEATATEYSLYNDDAATVDQKATLADDGTTASRAEMTTGP